MVKIWVHSNISQLSNGKNDWTISLNGGSTEVETMLKNVFKNHPQLLFGIIDETNTLRRHINIFLGEVHLRRLDGLATEVKDGDEIYIFPAVSGG